MFVLVEVVQARLGVKLCQGWRLLFADLFVGVSESGEQLQRLTDVVHSFCQR